MKPTDRRHAVIDVVGAAIVDRLPKPMRLLAARRRAGTAHAGRWELPGGKVEPGERPTQALVREIAEELGSTAYLHDRLAGPLPGDWWPLAPPGADVSYRMAVWVVTLEEKPEPVEGHDELRWLTPDELFSVHWIEADLPIIAALRSHLWGAGVAALGFRHGLP